MKAQLTKLAIIVLFFNLVQGCGTSQPEKTERTQTTGGGVDEFLGFEESGEEASAVLNDGEEFWYSTEGEGFGLAESELERKNPHFLSFFKESMDQYLELSGDPRRAAVVAVTIGRGDETGVGTCRYFRARWLDREGKRHELKLMPEGQSADCGESLKGRYRRRILGGAIIAVARVSAGTYAGAAGIGVLAVTSQYVAGCAAGAAGILSQELDYVAGVAGAACGSVPTHGYQY